MGAPGGLVWRASVVRSAERVVWRVVWSARKIVWSARRAVWSARKAAWSARKLCLVAQEHAWLSCRLPGAPGRLFIYLCIYVYIFLYTPILLSCIPTYSCTTPVYSALFQYIEIHYFTIRIFFVFSYKFLSISNVFQLMPLHSNLFFSYIPHFIPILFLCIEPHYHIFLIDFYDTPKYSQLFLYHSYIFQFIPFLLLYTRMPTYSSSTPMYSKSLLYHS